MTITARGTCSSTGFTVPVVAAPTKRHTTHSGLWSATAIGLQTMPEGSTLGGTTWNDPSENRTRCQAAVRRQLPLCWFSPQWREGAFR
jgi:hypothetical protein